MQLLWFGLITFILTACSTTSPKAETEFRAAHVITCRHWTNQCYHKANEKCRGGYDLVSTAEIQRSGPPRDGFREFKIVVKCK